MAFGQPSAVVAIGYVLLLVAGGVGVALGSLWAAFVLPPQVGWLPALLCTAVAVWLWRLPTRRA